MKEYHKIQSVYLRDPENHHKTFLTGQWTQPEFALLSTLEWVGTEKVDGTNIRVIWDGESVRFGGKTDNAQIPAVLFTYLMEHFTTDRLKNGLKGPVTLYGEGYGGKIQKGGRYQQDQRFILFDVWADAEPMGVWLPQPVVKEIAAILVVPSAPTIFTGELPDAIKMGEKGFVSKVAEDSTLIAEGLVLRPASELRDRMGRRIITKVKYKDFP